MEIDSGKQGRDSETKILAVIAAECTGKQAGKIRFKCIDATTTDNLTPFIQDNVVDGSVMSTLFCRHCEVRSNPETPPLYDCFGLRPRNYDASNCS